MFYRRRSDFVGAWFTYSRKYNCRRRISILPSIFFAHNKTSLTNPPKHAADWWPDMLQGGADNG
jgi:hypothetical protein